MYVYKQQLFNRSDSADTKFTQQKLPAFKPLLTPRVGPLLVICIYLLVFARAVALKIITERMTN